MQDLVVGGKAGQHAGGVVVVKELAAEFQVELAAEVFDALADSRGLETDVLLTVETDFVHGPSSLFVRLNRLYTNDIIPNRVGCNHYIRIKNRQDLQNAKR